MHFHFIMHKHSAINSRRLGVEMAAESSVEHTSVDENGDEIILEAECSKYSVCNQLGWILVYGMAAALVSVFFFPFCIIIYCATVKKWRLYLTKRGIYHTRPGGFGCCVDHWFIPIEDIQNIQVQAHATNQLLITVGPEKVKEFIHWCNRPLCFEADSLILTHVKNADQFAESVKREKTNI